MIVRQGAGDDSAGGRGPPYQPNPDSACLMREAPANLIAATTELVAATALPGSRLVLPAGRPSRSRQHEDFLNSWSSGRVALHDIAGRAGNRGRRG